MKPCIPVVDLLKFGFVVKQELILTELQPFELNHFRQLFAL